VFWSPGNAGGTRSGISELGVRLPAQREGLEVLSAEDENRLMVHCDHSSRFGARNDGPLLNITPIFLLVILHSCRCSPCSRMLCLFVVAGPLVVSTGNDWRAAGPCASGCRRGTGNEGFGCWFSSWGSLSTDGEDVECRAIVPGKRRAVPAV